MNKEDKCIEAQAEVLSINKNNYTIGFTCPNCADGFIKTNYMQTDTPLNIGDIIPVKITAITMVDGHVTAIALFDEKPKPGHMPDIVAKARELEILSETNTGQYKVVEIIDKKLYRIKNTEDGTNLLGLAKKEMELDTLANQEDFEGITEEHELASYSLIHHWWDNGKFEHWDLFINDNECTTHLVFERDPLKNTEIKSVQRHPYTDDFWMRGEKLEIIAPGQPGNPSKLAECTIERLDMGKLAVYESEKQMDGTHEMRVEFFGTALEGRWLFRSSVAPVWHALKETVKLSEDLPVQLALQGKMGAWEETPDGLRVTGTALSFGTWNGFYWSPEVIMNSPLDDFDNMIVDVEHKNDLVAGAILQKSIDGPNVNVEFLIKDYETAEKIKSGELAGLSIDASVFADPVRRMVVGVKQYKRLTVCGNPACRVCFFG